MIQYLYLGRVPYDEGLRLQAEIAALRLAGRVPNILLLLEHPPVLTLGRNAHRANVLASAALLAARGITLHEINRGGDVTYHGPGQLVGYPIFDLRSLRGPSGGRMGPVDFVRGMEEALIRLCAGLGAPASRIQGLTGVWCGEKAGNRDRGTGNSQQHQQPAENFTATSFPAKASTRADVLNGPDSRRAELCDELRCGRALYQGATSVAPQPVSYEREGALAPERRLSGSSGPARKIAAIGIHVSRGITTHGFAFNLNPNLADFDLIVPCGIRDHAVTSLESEVGRNTQLPTLEQLAHLAAQQFAAVFDEPVTAAASLAALRAQAEQQFPAEDTPLQIPPELDRLHATAERPVRA